MLYELLCKIIFVHLMGTQRAYGRANAQAPNGQNSSSDPEYPLPPTASITLFEHKEFGGRNCTMTVESFCTDLCSDDLNDRISSIKGNASCVHFFKHKDCGKFLFKHDFVKDGDMHNLKDTKFNDMITTVGSCDVVESTPAPKPEDLCTHKDIFGGCIPGRD